MTHAPVVVDEQKSSATFANFNFVSAEYFSVVGITVTKGRTFTAAGILRTR